MQADDIPGFPQAAAVIRHLGGEQLTPTGVRALALAAVAAASAQVKAELFADLADELADQALSLPSGEKSGVLLALAQDFDQASHTIREATRVQ